MQLYEGLPIMTNKIKPEDRKGIPHHLLGCVNIQEEPWTVHNFVNKALQTIESLHRRGRLPILVGGTHYYLQSLLFKDSLSHRNLDFLNDASHKPADQNWSILNAPTPTMFAELKRIDPVIASRWHPNERRKIRRSLEIFLETGQKASDVYREQHTSKSLDQQTGPDFPHDQRSNRTLRFPTLIFWTHTDREVLTQRLGDRVECMVQNGLLDEVQKLEAVRQSMVSNDENLDDTRGIWVSIGFKEFRSYLDALYNKQDDQRTISQRAASGIEQIKIATRQYSKAQIKWIRIKLVNALRDVNAQQMFLLPTDDSSTWDENVVTPAVRLTGMFLDGEHLPDPLAQSDIAAQMLLPKRGYDMSQRADLWQSNTCDECNVTAVTLDQWNKHVQSRRHRNTLKAKLKNTK